MRNLDIKNIKSHPSLSLAKANASRDLQINFNQAEDALTIPAESRHDYKCGSTTQRGRSMIEMLGVLAIIGVLSVGGIAGYSKAMMKYRINKTIEQITLIVGNVRTFFAPQGNYDGLGSGNDIGGNMIIKKAKLVPDEMWGIPPGESYESPLHAFGGEFRIQGANKTADIMDRGAFLFILWDIPQEACIEISTMDWNANSGSSIASLSVNPQKIEEGDELPVVGCISNARVTCAADMPMTIDKASSVCLSGYNIIYMKFY